ncbi:putative kinase [Motilibacter peucedani]|uniref:Putative kinase n=1 Tax=Motilibacter peucedani TaxID=598650 RepID=A0A420XSL8_9ACTN|nr:ATP-binding protein [Motilibacter peucedani]RKS77864.1 putative kinase [Motilibacter peucedani]
MTPTARTPVVLMCGIAGSGKSTCARRLESRGYVRLSIDEEVWQRFGRYGLDYEPDAYEELSEAARRTLDQRLSSLVAEGRPVVVDSSLWQRARRDEVKRIVETAGGTWRLIYLQADEELLRERLRRRAERFDADAAFPITDELLARFLAVFEVPSDEGEEVVVVRDD